MTDVGFRLVDVGGQRSERRKWIHCFEGVSAILYVMAINEYDEKLFEDESVNRMHESIELFASVCKEKFLKNIPIIVFLNKVDLFMDKILKVDLNGLYFVVIADSDVLSVCFPEYTGGRDYDNAISFIKKKLKANRDTEDRLVYFHPSCATDTENIRFVFAAVKDSILQNIMNDSDLFK